MKACPFVNFWEIPERSVNTAKKAYAFYELSKPSKQKPNI